ncbi:hypothetical protein AR1Y2_1994 [Anaerostipes rhamnosivorans]|uniref:Uncharacterized protein n=1 Tax=Anaerostipes rhamnosivorans TaxID=1229621 RepID=A0A4P8ICR6_9FIRM|nr:hypothetical protein AR1Y2_1994 [Anaerostipes rhamnosivorans]
MLTYRKKGKNRKNHTVLSLFSINSGHLMITIRDYLPMF